MKISKIGAKVRNCNITLVQSKRKGGFFFIAQNFDFEKDNLITKYWFCSVISLHNNVFGHDIFKT